MRLLSSITSNSVKLIELYNKIISGSLITKPKFQRKLVWKKQHKYAFIETILLNFPFPEIYIASLEVDVDTMLSKEEVVDGQQRLTTIVDYIKASGDFKDQKTVKPFDSLTIEEKKEFLNYNITVKDLKDIGEKKIIEIFKRINSTDYSLNSNEILNAEYGGGEFAMFCKALVEPSEELNPAHTDIKISDEERSLFLNFFKENEVFTDNDIKRMFDTQFIMLITTTLLEGSYFGRSTKIDLYLEKYNSAFDRYEEILSLFKNSLEIIISLNFSSGSYWFNKPNLFTLIFELRKVNIEQLNLEVFETKLLELEQKMDLYFNADEETDISHITEDERKYFEVARQGSHELASRQHRGKIISKLIGESKRNSTSDSTISQAHAIIIPTETGLKKGIIDATSSVREFLKGKKIHDYESQDWGPENKIIKNGVFVVGSETTKTKVSLYRSKGRGDYRIWFKDLNTFASANEELEMSINEGIINIKNLTKLASH